MGREMDGPNSDLEKFNIAMNSYNNAINILNTRAESYQNEMYASDARSVGSVPNNKNAQSGYFTSIYTYMEDYNGKLRDSDENYQMDMEKMETLGIKTLENEYWIASNSRSQDSDFYIWFNVRKTTSEGNVTSSNLFRIYSSGSLPSYSESCGLRPVFTLKSTIKITGGSGTKEAPYTLGT